MNENHFANSNSSNDGLAPIVVVGAGPAGLTAAFELLSRGPGRRVVVLEETRVFGGISRTVLHNGNRMDMGGHRFFSKVAEVNDWWERSHPAAPTRRKRIA